MQLVRLELLNWCQHRVYAMDFSPGLTAVIGPNGSGKSNVLGAIRWLLTGDNPNPGELAENICEEAAVTDRANGTLSMRHQGQLLSITRHLRPESSKATLSVDGVVVARGARDVNQRLTELLDMDSAAINRFVLIQQGDIFGVLAESDEVRSKTLQRLFDTRFAADLVEVITKHDSKLQVQDYRPQLDTLRTTLTQLRSQLTAARTAVAGKSTPAEIESALTADRTTVAVWQQRQQLNQRLLQVQQSLTAQQQIRDNLTNQLQSCQTDYQTLVAAVDGSRDNADQARAAILNAQQVRRVQAQRTQVEQQIQTLEAQIAALVVPVAQPEDSGYVLTTLADEINSLQGRIGRNQTFVRQFRTAGVTNCPTCGTPTTSLADQITAAEAEINDDTANIVTLSARRQRLLDHQRAVDAYDAANTRLRGQLAAAKAQLSGLDTVTPVTADEVALTQVVNQHAEFVVGANTMQGEVNRLTTQVATVDGTLSSLTAEQTRHQTELGLITVTEADATAASQRIADRTQVLNEIITAQRLEANLDAHVTRCQADIVDTERKIAENDRVRAWLQDGEEVKSVLKLLPKIIARDNLQQLEVMINESLGICGAPFRVTADETLSFTGRFTNGRTQRARRFSGGQKVLLALLFRIAVNIKFAAGIGFLGLDEPTVYLDKRSIAAFRPLFARLRELMAQRGLQCLIITHEDELAPLFDTVVSLEAR